ncbi:MAG: winged helix-turn-helix domain-containing protein [Sphingobacteriales bacterium]|nr:MAG: winged helix-turn-helix domain-containing protein [Sphingobacteriales bacterium]
MQAITLTKSQARKIILHAAGLAKPAQFGYGIEAVYNLIEHLGYLQLDTNYVVERAHHHALFARIPDYQTEWLAELCNEGRVFEYFISESGFLPMDDFRFSLPVKEEFKAKGKNLSKAELLLMQQILDQVERDGVVRVSDFENDRLEASTGWWDWRPAKVALERLYFQGRLMISRDTKFHKSYDVPMNLVHTDTDLTMPTAAEFARYVIKRTLGALGISSVKEISWRARRVKKNLVKSELDNMVREGEVLTIQIEGIKSPLFMLANQEMNPEVSGDVFILSPFDILNVFRPRLREFFDFDYQVECFVPASKRLYGYFSLPVLSGEAFIARMDAKADRKNKLMLVHNIHFEGVKLNKETIKKFISALKAFAVFNKCLNIQLVKSNNTEYLEELKKAF